MTTDAENFLDSILFAMPENDNGEQELAGLSVHDFAPDFVAAVESFCSAFRDYVAGKLPETDPDDCERSFGSNVYFSLSGHGCGFWDDSDSTLGDALQSALVDFVGGDKYRFEWMDLYHFKRWKKPAIHIAMRTPALRRDELARLFAHV